ncbi:putative epoxide hydrolase [Pseudocercospora fuligena]|uniref:Putative epoxide hydrolase n=1 Tax=Pseudocercospora fuligena TaxID=685502 RepID=A0A8H6VRY3_9PEZI|nr:putative epoxide hydrolase [Pseudocercospora fuligena]
MSAVKEYTINVPQDKIDRLKRRLDEAEFPSELEDAAWDYGSPLKDIKRIVEYWRTKFDWGAHEKKLNELPNFEVQVNIDKHGPVDMHFVHQKSDVPGAIPLLFVHGWPGSFLEVTKMLPLLKGGDGKPAFHVVAPSLPNYGFSGPALKRGFNVARYAEACHKVMLALGYNEYVTQGGDWGFLITRALGHLYPKNVKASHINWAWAAKPEEYANDAASYIYYEALHDPVEITVPIVQGYIDVPLGIADFPVELCNSPQSWRHTMGPIVFQKLYEKGGHFAGWERPGDLADGLCEMFGKGGGAYGVVSGKDGY